VRNEVQKRVLISKSILCAVAILVIAAVFFVGFGGGDKPSALVGLWIYGSGDDGIRKMKLYKYGRGLLNESTVSWKVENKRLVISSSDIALTRDYKISGYELTLVNDDGDSAILVKKEKLGEFIEKQATAKEAKRLKEVAEKVKEYTEQAKRNKPQIEQILEQYFVFVQGGTFTMGCTAEQGKDCINDDKPAHSVTVSDFSIGKYEVTQKLWNLAMGNNPSKFRGDDLPVESVSWNDVQIFISLLNTVTGKKYRLPTEAEWEFAARGGNKSTVYHIYSGSNNLNEVGWYRDNSGDQTHPVGQKQPNELGIYDMSGNVCEWCGDWYGDYPTGAVTNPTGAGSGDYRVLRGGGWYINAQNCRLAYRLAGFPSDNNPNFGFRVAVSE